MKRYNIHLDPKWMKDLDKILAAVREAKVDGLFWWGTVRADLIRFALREVFNLSPDTTYNWGEHKIKALRKFLKKRKSQKGV